MDLEQQKKKWENLDPSKRRFVIVVGALTTVMQLVMLWDLWRRPTDQIRGSKRAWAAASFARPFGQIGYLVWGRRPPR